MTYLTALLANKTKEDFYAFPVRRNKLWTRVKMFFYLPLFSGNAPPMLEAIL